MRISLSHRIVSGARTAFIIFIAFLAFISLATSPHRTHAQSFINPTEGQAMRITVFPQYPKAFERVTVTVEDFSRDINGLTVSWSLNGRSATRGVGLKTFTFETGALGSVSNVSVSAGGVSQTIAIRPTEIDLIWQASSYTPPFYEGKALHTNQDTVTFLAEPFFITRQGTRINPATLVYKWKYNGNVMQNASGYGKRSFSIQSSVLAKPIAVEVEVSNTAGDFVSVASIGIHEVSPQVIVYENSPLYGLRTETALNGKVFAFGDKTETTFTAVPFFFSTPMPNSDALTYTWLQNGAPTSQKGNSVIFRAPAEGEGVASISVSAKHVANYLQGANASFNVDFRKPVNNTPGI